MKFPIINGQAAFTTAAVDPGDIFFDSLLYENNANAEVRITVAPGTHFSNGLRFGTAGRLIYVDATAGLPADVIWCNGLPVDSSGHLCISTNPAVLTQNGIPFVANGAVAAAVTP